MIFNNALSTKSYNRFLTIEEEFNKIYNYKYNYENSIYNGFKSTFTIECNLHGSFNSTPQKHINGQECPICTQIKKYGHIEISKSNIENYKDLVINYLSKKYINFDFENIKYIDNKINFKCKKHGEILSSKIECKKCNKELKEKNKNNTLLKLLKNRDENIISLEYNNVKLQCKHGNINTYNNKQLYGKVQLCDKCSNSDFNKISQNEFIQRAIEKVGNIYDIKNTKYINAITKIPLKCDIHGKFYMLPSNFFKGQGCSKCTNRTSKVEDELLQFINKSKQSDRKLIEPYELDILSNKHKFAIEYNGLMWHSYGKNKSSKFNNYMFEYKNKHLLKTELVEEKGYQLFHIFENEWLNLIKKEIWKSVINSKINNTERIYARKCIVKEVNFKDTKEFENKNHLQGSGISSIRLGLYYENELVSLMTFGKSRFNKSIEYELIRFCSKLNYTIIGGASKLLKFFEKNYKPKSLISYANRRWSTGNVYEKLGFEFIKNTKPNYFYFKSNENILYSRNNFQKHKLKDKLEVFDEKLTETENMYNNGYRKIYDSGNKVYIKKYK